MTTQEKFDRQLHKLVSYALGDFREEFDLICDKSYSNVGSYKLEYTDSWETMLKITFDFQHQISTFRITNYYVGASPNDYRLSRENWEQLFDAIYDELMQITAQLAEQ